MCVIFFFFGGGGISECENFQEIQIWHVRADQLVCWGHECYEIGVTETQSTLTLQNIAYPDFQNMNNLLHLNFRKTSGKF